MREDMREGRCRPPVHVCAPVHTCAPPNPFRCTPFPHYPPLLPGCPTRSMPTSRSVSSPRRRGCAPESVESTAATRMAGRPKTEIGPQGPTNRDCRRPTGRWAGGRTRRRQRRRHPRCEARWRCEEERWWWWERRVLRVFSYTHTAPLTPSRFTPHISRLTSHSSDASLLTPLTPHFSRLTPHCPASPPQPPSPRRRRST